VSINDRTSENRTIDAVVVGAGFAGIYATVRLRELGLTVRGVEAASDVGGTWHWNRYPGCRCDVPTLEYSYSFDEELEQSWSFPENMSAQPEIEKYLGHVADRYAVRDHFVFDTTVTGASFDEAAGRWHVRTSRDDRYDTTWLILATGALSVPNVPNLPGLDRFEGTCVHTARWPQDGLDLTGKRVAVVGTGSSGVQIVPRAAEVSEHVYVVQRTPTFAFPRPLNPTDVELEEYLKTNYREMREMQRRSVTGIANMAMPSADGGAPRSLGFGALPSPRDWGEANLANEMADRFGEMVRSVVKDPATADALTPTDVPFGCKRLVVEIGYFESFNRDNVTLLDVGDSGVEFTETAMRTKDGEFDVDVVVLATGFDALSGSFARLGLLGRGGRSLTDKWAEGPVTYLGVMTEGFPNAFMIAGPGSPSVISNMVVSIEQHVDFVSELIEYARQRGVGVVEPNADAEREWVDHVNAVAAGTPLTAPTCKSWYLGANVSGKPRVFMPYVGGVGDYRDICDGVARDDYRGFELTAAG
jgi:cation diffusion facilitator CzcD-associated flavoprotein CzcO